MDFGTTYILMAVYFKKIATTSHCWSESVEQISQFISNIWQISIFLSHKCLWLFTEVVYRVSPYFVVYTVHILWYTLSTFCGKHCPHFVVYTVHMCCGIMSGYASPYKRDRRYKIIQIHQLCSKCKTISSYTTITTGMKSRQYLNRTTLLYVLLNLFFLLI